MSDFEPGMTLKSRKKHPCGGNTWKIIRVGADVKLECATCGRIVDVTRADAKKRFTPV